MTNRQPLARRATVRAAGLALTVGAVLVLSVGCGRGGEGDASGPPRATPVAVAIAIQQDVEVIRRSVGTVRATESIEVASEIDGVISVIAFSESGRVQAGDVLFRLNAHEAEAQLEAARARLNRIQREAETIAQLFGRGSATQKEHDDSRSALLEAQAAERVTQTLLDQHTIRAPFDGQVGLRQRSLGAYVRAGDPLTTLVATDPIEVRFQLPERAMAEVAVGQPVSLRSPAFPDRSFVGRVAAVDTSVDPQTRSITVSARLPNPQAQLKPGMFADVELVTQVRRDAVIVPETAIISRGAEASLLIVDDQGAAARLRVRTGQRRAGLVEIVDGLAAGTMVITSDPGQVREGATVDPRPDQTLAALGIDAERFIRDLPAAPARAERRDP
jgi:membrane fusion protein (multidrug efflux system)